MNCPIKIVSDEVGIRILVLSDLMEKTTNGRKEALAIIFEDYAKCQDKSKTDIYETLPKYIHRCTVAKVQPGRVLKLINYLKEKLLLFIFEI